MPSSSFLLSRFIFLFTFVSALFASSSFAAPLDFDGDGLSDVSTYLASDKNQRKRTVTFRWKLLTEAFAANDNISSERVIGQYPVVGEYLGNGKTQLAAIRLGSGIATWHIKGVSKPIQFGRAGDTFISGCRFVSSRKSSLSYMRGRILVATEVNRASSLKVKLPFTATSEILGCGDITGDGIDELLFKTQTKGDNPDAVVAYGIDGKRKLIKRTKKFIRFISVKRPDGTFDPLIAVSRQISPTERGVKIESFFGSVEYPTLFITLRADVTNGIFLNKNNQIASGLLYTESRGKEVFNRIIDDAESDTTVFIGRKNEKLVKAVAIYKTS